MSNCLLSKISRPSKLKETLLWTNSTAAAQGSQTINLDLSSYQFVRLEFRKQAGSGELESVCATIGMQGHMCSKTPSWDIMGSRSFSVTDSYVTFGGGVGIYTQGNNNCAVPYRIYGWK